MVSIAFNKFTLSNGLEVILQEDHALPMTAVNVWYHVGSKDEEVGRTGFAHLFEHVMFEGSKNHKNSYFEPLQKVGAVLNGSTTNDRTNYWENVPSNYLELALWLESDRMGFLLDALDQKSFDVQRDVVKNERRQSYENRPYGMAHLKLQPTIFPAPHPYNWPTIGSQEDLDAAELEDIKDFFRMYYAPSNASLAIVGDFDPNTIMATVELYFGDIPPGPPITRFGRMDSDLTGKVTMSMHDKVQLPRSYMVWPTGPAFDEQQAPLDILSAVLGDGKSSRLHKKLVLEKQIARDVRVYHHGQEIAGEFFVQATANPGQSLHEIEAIIDEEMARIAAEPPTEHEVMRAKNRIQSHHVRQLEKTGGFGGRADLLNFYNSFLGDPGVINTDLDRYLAVTPDQIKKAAQLTLGSSNVRLTVLPENAFSPSVTGIDRSKMPGGSEATSFQPPTPQRGTLSNGMGIVTLNKPGIPLVSMGLMIRAGGITDPKEKPGVAELTAAILTEGTSHRTRDEISDEMEFLGAELLSSASREYITVATETLTDHWTTALDILADVSRNASYPQEEFDRVKAEHLTDLSRISDSPTTIASRAARALQFGHGTRYGHPLSGTVDSVTAINRDDLVEHFSKHYGPQGSTLILVGDVTHEQSMEKAEGLFGSWESIGTPQQNETAESFKDDSSPTTIYLADKPGAAQSVIRAGHLTVPRHNPDYFSMNLMNYIFGGQFSARLNMNLRQEKGYSYGYMSSIDWFTDSSSMSAGGSVQTEVTKESIVETLKEFADVQGSRPITEEEFTDSKDGILRGFPAQFETQGQMVQQLIRIIAFDLPNDYFQRYPEHVGGVQLDDVHRVAKDNIHGDQLKIVVVGDAAVIEPGLKELGLPLVRIDYEGHPIS
ncbi:MAG: pitrilysin family protein [Chloroflexi bacterium]|nr:pitrilysin family protein [Chloroflexota bacterium]